MATWNDLREEFNRRRDELGPTALDIIRREHLKRLADHTGRPLLIYAVDFLHQPNKARAAGQQIQIEWADKEGIIEVIDALPTGSLDLLIHSPGGDPLAAESIVSLLRAKFDNIRVIVPNVAKSAATMIALSGDAVVMDERGELGPIDPQMVLTVDRQIIISPAQAILDQFEAARLAVQANPNALPGWLPQLRQYGPSLLQESRNAIALSIDLVRQWLVRYMFRDEADAESKADKIANYLGNHNNFKSHGKRIAIDDVIQLGGKVIDLRQDPELRRLVWAAYMAIGLTFDFTPAFKIIENSNGGAYVKIVQQVQIVGNPVGAGLNPPAPPSISPAGGLTPAQQRQRRQQRKRT